LWAGFFLAAVSALASEGALAGATAGVAFTAGATAGAGAAAGAAVWAMAAAASRLPRSAVMDLIMLSLMENPKKLKTRAHYESLLGSFREPFQVYYAMSKA